ncbi:unnamed protein product, partial [Mesorhabditis spiculigera]
MASLAGSSVWRWVLVLLYLAAFSAAALQNDDYWRILLQNAERELESRESQPAVRARRTLMHRASRSDMPMRTIQNPSDLPMFRFG